MVKRAPNPQKKTFHFLAVVSIFSELSDGFDRSISIQPFAVVGLLAYKAVTDKGADKPQLLVDYNRKQDELVSTPRPPNWHKFATNLYQSECTLRLIKVFFDPQKYLAIKLTFRFTLGRHIARSVVLYSILYTLLNNNLLSNTAKPISYKQ